MITDVTGSHLYQEIQAQPAVLHRFLAQELEHVEALGAALRKNAITQVVIAARGTSDNAGRYAKYVLGAFNQLQVALATPSLFTHYAAPPKFERTLVLGISQSGRSPDIIEVLEEARRQEQLTAVITNTPDSPLAEVADHVIGLQAGPERSVAATKSYTASLLAIAALSLSQRGEGFAQLQGLPEKVAHTLSLEAEIAQLAKRYRFMQHCVVIGRGFNYATAFEVALKLKELTYTIVEPYSSADFLHGPLALVEQGFPVMVFAPRGRLDSEHQAFMRQIQGRLAEVLCISDVPESLAEGDLGLQLPVGVAEWLSPLTAVIPGQLLALHLAAQRGFDVDQPRAIRKVTETR